MFVCAGAGCLCGELLNWAYLLPIAILTDTHLGMLFPFLTKTCFTKVHLAVQCSPISFLKDCCLMTFPHFLLVITLTYLGLVPSECHPKYFIYQIILISKPILQCTHCP